MSHPVVLEARNVVVERRSRRTAFALEVPALELRAGEALAILGPNGAGKTTLLLALAGLLEPQSGAIERRGEGRVTMVFQRPVAFDGSVAHNVGVALLGQEMAQDEKAHRVAASLEHFGITDLAGRRAAQLSGGELRRVALARAFALRPTVLLLDEPFDDLDPAAQESLCRDLEATSRETGVALALVTHDLRRAVLLADRMAVLVGGRVEQIDLVKRVLASPANPEVAQLVGMTNLIAGTVRQHTHNGNAVVEVDSGNSLQARTELPLGTQVVLGLRPEHLKLDLGRGESAPIGEAVVRHLASDSLLTTLTLDWGGRELRTHLVAGRGPARKIAPGDRVGLSVKPEDLHVMRR